MKTVSGVIHGKTIELADDPGMEDGAKVEIMLRPAKQNCNSGDGLRRFAGALAEYWTDDDDRILADIAEDRRKTQFREILE